jgi:hypothetical protein
MNLSLLPLYICGVIKREVDVAEKIKINNIP